MSKCSFCDKAENQVEKLIQGPRAFICNKCVDICNRSLGNSTNDAPQRTPRKISLPSAPKIRKILDQHIVSQDKAKKFLTVAIRNHYKQLTTDIDLGNIEIQKSNILLIGDTGTGKTLLAQTFAKALNVPLSISDATGLTQAGYVGEDVEAILFGLIQEADGNIERAETGIVYIDEIDKIARKMTGSTTSGDISGEGVQQSLLKMMEGKTANVPSNGVRKDSTQKYMQIDTTNILFICGGAFVGLDKIIQRRIGRKSIGFNNNIQKQEEILEHVTPQDLLEFGLIPEFIGRLPVIANLDNLTRDDLVTILTKPQNALIKQYQKLFEMDGIALEFQARAINAIADIAVKRNTGARGLKAVLENLLVDTMYEISPDDNIKKCIVTLETVTRNQKPILIRERDLDRFF